MATPAKHLRKALYRANPSLFIASATPVTPAKSLILRDLLKSTTLKLTVSR